MYPLYSGRVKFGLYPLRKSWVVDVPSAGASDLRLVVGDVARVEVQVVDGASGAVLPVEGVAWSPWEAGLWEVEDPEPGSPAEVFLQGMEVVHVDPATGWGAFLAPAGDLNFGFWHAGYGEDGRRVRVRAGAANRFQLALQPRPTLSLAFVAPDGELVYGSGHELEPVDDPGEAELQRQVDGRYEFTFEEAGRWRVVGAPKGWRQRAGSDATVRVRPGEAARLDVQVVEGRDDEL